MDRWTIGDYELNPTILNAWYWNHSIKKYQRIQCRSILDKEGLLSLDPTFRILVYDIADQTNKEVELCMIEEAMVELG